MTYDIYIYLCRIPVLNDWKVIKKAGFDMVWPTIQSGGFRPQVMNAARYSSRRNRCFRGCRHNMDFFPGGIRWTHFINKSGETQTADLTIYSFSRESHCLQRLANERPIVGKMYRLDAGFSHLKWCNPSDRAETNGSSHWPCCISCRGRQRLPLKWW